MRWGESTTTMQSEPVRWGSTNHNDAASFDFKQEFRLYYQPIILLGNKSLYAFEGLACWRPDRAKFYASKPLTLAEKSQLAVPFHQWVIDEVCHQLQVWRMQYVEDALSCLSINLSAKPFFYSYLAEYIAQMLRKIGVRPSYLQLEIPAKWVMHNRSIARSAINRFGQAGISIGIDDLKLSDLPSEDWVDWPVKSVKIKNIDVDKISRSPDIRNSLKATISAANKADIQIISKDIETADQLLAMQSLGCTYGQGGLLSNPLPSRQATALISSYTRRTSPDLVAYLSVMSMLNQTAQKFLGESVVARYWRETRPPANWLLQLRADENFERLSPLPLAKNLTVDQQSDLQHWSNAFIQRCSLIIRHFPQLLAQHVTTPRAAQELPQLQK